MRGRRQGRMGRGVSAAAWLCPPSAPQGSASLSATSPRRARQSGTETPAWRCRLGDIERLKRLPMEGADTPISATAQRPQEETRTNTPR